MRRQETFDSLNVFFLFKSREDFQIILRFYQGSVTAGRKKAISGCLANLTLRYPKCDVSLVLGMQGKSRPEAERNFFVASTLFSTVTRNITKARGNIILPLLKLMVSFPPQIQHLIND